jgi:hypothetical protein
MRYRTALADGIEMSLGWTRPVPSPLTKYERQREEELEKAVKEAARRETEAGAVGVMGMQPQFSRSFRGFLGFKEGKRVG